MVSEVAGLGARFGRITPLILSDTDSLGYVLAPHTRSGPEGGAVLPDSVEVRTGRSGAELTASI
jgi:hypothetical protein